MLHGHVPAAVTNLPPMARLPGTATMDLVVALPLRNAEGLTQLLREMYDPASPRYRQYLTPAQFAEQFGPAEQDYQQLVAFAKAQGFTVTQTHSNRTLLNIRGTVTDVERTLHVTLHTYRHPTEARFFHAPDVEPSLDLQVPILAVHGLDDYGTPRPAGLHPMPQVQGAKPQAGSAPDGSYWGHDFRAAYLPGVTLSGAGQVVALLEMDGYFTNDIAAYKTQAGLPDVPITNILISGYSGAAGANNDEVALDIEMALAMAPGLSAVAVYESTNTWAAYVSMLNRMATDNLAKQISASWTWTGVSKTSLDTTFLQFAAQGQSFFNASGDSGAYPGTIPTPADDPYVTVVGGTTLTTSGPGGAWLSETTWSWFPSPADASSGGFSTSYTLPSWQAGISMASNQGSTTRRNLPDVALTADNIWVIYNNGGAGAFGGTSAASPLWAGLTALINQRIMAQGQSPVGFINPVIYAIGTGTNYAAAFHDIATGNNTNASSATKFSAVTGYDLCTGWGTPNGASLIQAFLLPPTITTVTPSSGPLAGGNSVIISGSNLGTGDVTSVTLCGIPATLVSDNSPSQVVVLAGAALVPSIGDVVVQSSSAGVATKTNGYTYMPPAPLALAATGMTVSGFYANWEGVVGATNYLLDVSTLGDFSICVPGYSNLSVGAVTTWRVFGLNMGSNYYYRVRAQQNGISSDSSGSIIVQTLMCSVDISSGPAVGGNLITITGVGLGSGSDITNVTICGVAAIIQSQTANSVTVFVPTGGQGTGDIVISSISQGTTTLKKAYTYHPPGNIFGAFLGWNSISNLPVTRAYLGAAAVAGKLYAVGGYNGTYQSTAYVYDPLQPSNGWTTLSSLPGARGYLAAAAVQGKLYALGGRSGSGANTYQSTVYVYDPLQSGLGWLSISNLPAARSALAAVPLNDKLYVLGGYSGSAYQSTAYVYDPLQPTAGWLSVSNLPVTSGYLGAAALNGKLYAVGGFNGSYQNTVYAYDPLQPTNRWSGCSNLPAGNGYLAAVGVNGQVLALGGYNTSNSYLATVNAYDPAQPAGGWAGQSTLPVARRGLAVAQLNGDLYALGGYNGAYLNTAYKGAFDAGITPASGSRLGGTTVTLTGNYLGSGDVTNVTLCGVPAAILTDNSPTQLVISTAASVIPTNGDVVVYSTSYGVTTRSNAFTYLEAYATLSVQASPANAGSVSGGGTFVVGAKVQLAATASNNWLFTGWNDGATNNPYSVTVPPTNSTYTANFSKIDSIGDGIPDWWRAQYFGGDGTTTNAQSCATADPDGDGLTNQQEFLAGTNPNDPSSSMHMLPAPAAAQTNSTFAVQWQSVAGKFYVMERSTNLVNGFDATLKTHIPATPPINSETDTNAVGPGPWFYRVRLE
jgi:N-acetylneuraminic acid mutarotase